MILERSLTSLTLLKETKEADAVLKKTIVFINRDNNAYGVAKIKSGPTSVALEYPSGLAVVRHISHRLYKGGQAFIAFTVSPSFDYI